MRLKAFSKHRNLKLYFCCSILAMWILWPCHESLSKNGKTPIENWRYPEEKDLKGDWLVHEKQNPFFQKADFNGDGLEDEAWILISKINQGWGVFVFLNKGLEITPILLEQEIQKNNYYNFGIGVMSPGKYKTACGKGYFDCKNGEPTEIETDYPGILYFKFESAVSAFIWDKSTESFKIIWLTD